MTERLEQNPAIEQDKQYPTIRNLLAASSEEMSSYWQDKTFLLEFPGLAVYLISGQGRNEFPEEERAKIFDISLRSLLSSDNRQLTAYSINAKEKVLSGNQNRFETEEKKTDSFAKAVLASILLIGMSLNNREKLIGIISQTHQDLTSSKRSYLTDAFGRLLMTNNIPRAWIKGKKLDSDNAFDWDSELARLLFFGIYKIRNETYRYIAIPKEMKANLIGYYSLETVDIMLDYSLDQAEQLLKSRSSSGLAEFISHIDTVLSQEDVSDPQRMIKKRMGEKLELLKQKLNFKMSQSPTTF